MSLPLGVTGGGPAAFPDNEILRFFKELNNDLGITIIMITHEFDIAQYAKRLIHIYDGRINYDGAIPKSESILNRKTHGK